MRNIIAVGGVPGTGKTKLFREIMKNDSWVLSQPAKLVTTMFNAELNTHILGKYEEGEVFAGTDKLSMSVQPKLKDWIISTDCDVIYEGDRVFNQSFLEFCSTLPDVKLSIIFLDVNANMLEERYLARGSDQSEKFLRGRATKYGNLKSNFDLMPYLKTLNHENDSDTKNVIDYMRECGMKM